MSGGYINDKETNVARCAFFLKTSHGTWDLSLTWPDSTDRSVDDGVYHYILVGDDGGRSGSNRTPGYAAAVFPAKRLAHCSTPIGRTILFALTGCRFFDLGWPLFDSATSSMAPDIFRIVVERQTNGLQLPLYASYTVDPDRRKKALMEAKANKRFDEIRAFEGTYKDGQLWAEYTVQTTDIINGMEVPRQSELRYRLEANSPVKSAFIRVVVTNATITADIQRAVRPELPPNTSVTDGRSDFSFRYLSKDGDWLELHELPLFATRLQDTSWEENAGAAIKTFTRAVVAGLVFIPVVLITYYFIRKRRLFPRQLTTTKHTTNIQL